ncbi:replication initiator [Streptomonospora salina]|uniref:replication initiator n=1 Tax=Streptomonospora salina TaxID=104205 RepID=UPI0035E413E4
MSAGVRRIGGVGFAGCGTGAVWICRRVCGVLDRVEAAEYPAGRHQVERRGHCAAPACMRGSAAAVDGTTGEVRARYSSTDQPDGTLLVACGDRRARDVDAVAGTIPACTGSTLNDLRLRQPYRSVMGEGPSRVRFGRTGIR